MALILAQNETSESGHEYADRLGERYEYPARYRNQIREGERFIYYRGRRKAGGGTQPQVYLGVGVIGGIRQGGGEDRLVCDIAEYEPFPVPVPFKRDGGYLEPGAASFGSKAGLYFRRGVRPIAEADFRRILELGYANDHRCSAHSWDPIFMGAKDPALAWAVAIRTAKGYAAGRWTSADIVQTPRNNPGYDLEVVDGGQVIRFVRVKATTADSPRFGVSEGDLFFSSANAERFTLVVVYDMAASVGGGRVAARDGSIDDTTRLRPWKWIGAIEP